jgi:hypothetical protein
MAARSAEPRTAVDALAVALRLMNQNERPCVVIVENADLLVGAPSQVSNDHVTQVAYVRRLAIEVRTGRWARPRMRVPGRRRPRPSIRRSGNRVTS